MTRGVCSDPQKELERRQKIGIYSRSQKGIGKYPSQVRTLSDVEAAYVGAMLDGEGHIGREPHIYVTNTNVEIIATLLRAIGLGRVTPGSMGPQNRLQVWRYALTRINDVFALLPQIVSYSMKAQECLKRAHQRE